MSRIVVESLKPSIEIRVFGADSLSLLKHQWWVLGLRGICAIAFGTLALLSPIISLSALLIYFFFYLMADGGLALCSAWFNARHRRRWVELAIEGCLDLGLATLLLINPTLSLLVAVYTAGAWALLSGAALLIAGVYFDTGAWIMALAAAVSILLGSLLLFAPLQGAAVLAIWLGIYALLFGLTLTSLAWRLYRLSLGDRPNKQKLETNLPIHGI